MPGFHEQLQIVSALREKCRKCEDDLYRLRIELGGVTNDLRRADEKQTIPDSTRDREAAALREQMIDLESRLAKLREESRQLGLWFGTLEEQRRLIDHLRQNLAAVQNRIDALRRLLAELNQQRPLPTEKIKEVEGELERLEGILAEIEAGLRRASEDLHRLEDEERGKRSNKDEIDRAIEGLRGQLRETQGQLDTVLQPTFPDKQAVETEKGRLTEAIRDLHERCGDCDGRLHEAIVGLYEADPHPRVPLRNLDDHIPFLLFPVRLETIFVPVKDEASSHTELWVRVYPDDILVHTHEKALTKSEVAAGELYWIELLAAEHLRDERDQRRRAVWRHVVEIFGGQRAAWIARQTKPSDWDALVAAAASQTLPDLLIAADPLFFEKLLDLELSPAVREGLETIVDEKDGDALFRLAVEKRWLDRVASAVRTVITGFPIHDFTKTDGWTRAPRTRMMPDRFVLLLYSGETGDPREIVGEVIPDTLFLGPEPLDAKNSFVEKDGLVVYGSSFDWMSNFDKAVEQGMGFRVRLTNEEAARGFAKVAVLGLMLSASEMEGSALVEELVDNHQYSPKGFSIVPQGTPTNNTERDGTGYSDNDPYNDRAFFTANDPPAFDPADPNPLKSMTDGRRLADALGISYPSLQTVQHADRTDVLEALSMNTALFPSTLGYWLRKWMTPVVTPETARHARTFFTQFVSGRGPLPSVRVGNQPYGVLLTSDFGRWKYPDRNDVLAPIGFFREQDLFLRRLHALLKSLEKVWDGIVPELPFVGKRFSDSSDVLMNILGLHPTSVEFFQRIGYSTEYLRNLSNFKDNGRHAGELNSHLLGMPTIARSALTELGIQRDLDAIRQMRSLGVLWQHYTTELDVPNLVENKPPSETNSLTVNYVAALAAADTAQKIIDQQFEGGVPSALLYLMLRNALLLQLHDGAYEWLKQRTIFDQQLEAAIRPVTLSGIRAGQPAVSKLEIMSARVEVAEPTHPVPTTTVADWIWKGPSPTEVEAAFVKDQKAALQNLADSKTARLERCLVEHLDCCEYRLDAWQMGLFAQRLKSHRATGTERRMGIHLGAFGWLEELRHSTKTFIDREALPPSLRPSDDQPILEEDDVLTSPRGHVPGSRQGGFVHAPSLNHAAAAALLRSAYLSHASPEQAEMFSVNLSSERVRRAQFILDGMRNGQPVEALLGYQFERGLHDRTSESEARGDIPVLELNQFIVPYREAFTFESREVAQAGTEAAAETVPPFSVVNGLKLSQASLTAGNDFGLTAVLPAGQRPNALQGAAIAAEQNALQDTLDAVKDVLMAENAYQLAKGNFDRVAAVSLSQKEAHIPPELEVVNTPRGSEFTFTNRVTLHFDDLDTNLDSSNPWPPIALSPRANAEPGLNVWLGKLFGLPDQITCKVHWLDGTVQRNEDSVTLADLELQPVDFAWLVNISMEDTQGATELETRIAHHYRRKHGVGDDKTVEIQLGGGASGGQLTFAQVFPLARQIRALLAECRPLDAEDFLPAPSGNETEVTANRDNPKGYLVSELQGRVQSLLNELTALTDLLDGSLAPEVTLKFINDPLTTADDQTFTEKLGLAFNRLEEAKVQLSDTAKLGITFSLADAELLQRTLRSISAFGISDAFPPESDLSTDAARRAVLDRAFRVARRLRRVEPNDGILDRASALFNSVTSAQSVRQQVETFLAAGKILFGETFQLLPKFSCHNEIELATSEGDRAQLLDHAASPTVSAEEVVEEWLHGAARVRGRLHRWEVVKTLADALNDESLELRPVQVPYRANDSWLAVEFPRLDPNNTDPENPDKRFGVSRDTLSIVAHGDTAFKAGVRQCGFLIDDWTEEIPTDNETTGITFRFNQPNAEPPQTILLAVTPEETGSWEWDDLVGTLSDTFRRAKRRAVEPAQLERQGLGWNAFAPALVSEFSTESQSDISLDLMLMLDFEPLNEFYAKNLVEP